MAEEFDPRGAVERDQTVMTTHYYVLQEPLYTTDKGQVVPEGHPDARTMIGPRGHRIPHMRALELGLIDPHGDEEKARVEQANKQREALSARVERYGMQPAGSVPYVGDTEGSQVNLDANQEGGEGQQPARRARRAAGEQNASDS